MKKKLISLLLVLALVLSAFPAVVFAADEESNVNPATGREPGPAGNQKVALMVYGETISDAIMKSGYDIDDFWAALKSEAQGILANEKLPELEVYLVNDQNQEYRLSPSDGTGASMVNSFRLRSSGLLGWLEYVFDWLTDFYDWILGDVPTFGQLYKIYRVDNVPSGDYTLEVRKISGDGYKLWQPSSGSTRVHVGTDSMNYIGFEQSLGSHEFKVEVDLWLIDFEVEVASIDFAMPGVFLRSEKPGFSFTSADLAGNVLPGTEFMLINREETLKIVKAALALGKDTFTNAMNLVGTEGFTWDELNALNYDLVNVDLEGQQISINQEQAYKLLETYWMLIEASAKQPIQDFMSDETNIRLPAILKATADGNGIVRFTEDSNCTLTWSIEILFKMAGIVNEELQGFELDPDTFENENLQALSELILDVMKIVMENGTKVFDEYGNIITGVVNDWIYPILQNDSMMAFAKNLLVKYVGKDNLSERQMSMLDLLPTHALLTKKMPAGHYIMLETGVPKGYAHSPLFYTITIDWNTEAENMRDWCYVNVANLGVITPYFAEDYYTFLRTNSLTAEADKILNLITDGKTGTLIQDTLNGRNDITATTILYQASIIYNYMGGNKVYASEQELVDALNQHLYAYGRTAQNLLMFGNQVAQKAKNVVTCEITPDWTFYTATTSPRANIALRVKALVEGFAAAVDTTGGNAVTEFIKESAEKVAEAIDTTNYIAEQVEAVKEQVQDAVSTVAQKAIKAAVRIIGNIIFKKWP